MRKFILISAIVLASATAQAGESRSLTLAASDEPTAAAPAKAAETPKAAEASQAIEAPKAEAPKYVERPAAVETKTEQPTATQSNAEPAKPVAEKRAEKPRRKRYWNEARIINELHRHGIYW
jgi:hypothetical protein